MIENLQRLCLILRTIFKEYSLQTMQIPIAYNKCTANIPRYLETEKITNKTCTRHSKAHTSNSE